MKKVALISSFCDTQEKIDILKRNIFSVKSMNIDVILISPFYMDKDVVDMCDYFFVTKDNPVLDWPEKAMYMWKILFKDEQKIKITTTYSDYGFAGLTQVKQLSEIALNLEYERFYHMIYDLKIDENVISGLNSNESNSIYPSKRGETIWDVGLHFMIFDRENLKNFISKITKENYLMALGTDAFGWLHRNQKDLNYKIEKTPVEDEIYYYQEHDFFNYSEIPNVKFFIEKNDETLAPIKLLFYDVKGELNIQIRIDDNLQEYQIRNLDIVDLNFNKFNPKNVFLIHNLNEYEITSKVNKIKHNTLTLI